MKHLTVQDVMDLNPCPFYTRERVLGLFKGQESLSLLEIAELGLPAGDTLWVLFREEYLDSELFRSFGHEVANRAVEAYALRCGVEKIEEWARNWLSGEGRSSALALANYRASFDVPVEASIASQSALHATTGGAIYAAFSAKIAAASAVAPRIKDTVLASEEEWQLDLLVRLLRARG